MFTPEDDPDLEQLKITVVEDGQQEYSFGRKDDLNDHLKMLAAEFSGRSQIEFFHAATTVFVRRGLNRPACAARFRRMWEQEAEFLLSRLDSRWLVSACDTIMDTFDDPYEIATASAGVLFMNTIKLYETERLALGMAQRTPQDYRALRHPQRLFDGMAAYVIGSGEMVSIMVRRLRTTVRPGHLAPRIVLELLNRANAHDTVFRRFASVHTRNDTRWWV